MFEDSLKKNKKKTYIYYVADPEHHLEGEGELLKFF